MINLFKNLTDEELKLLFTNLNYEIKKYDKNETIINPTTNVDNIGIILEGSIILNKYDFCGNKFIITKLKKEDCFGEVYALTKAISNLEIQALEASKILFINIDYLLTNKDTNQVENLFMHNLTMSMAQKTLKINEKLEYLSIKNPREKILLFLTNKAQQKQTKHFKINFNREELASYLGVERTVLSKHLSLLKDEGLIDYHKNEFIIK